MSASSSARRALFIGNSYTARHDLPALIAGMLAPQLDLHTRSITAGGASLRRHWNAGHAQRAIEGGGYDTVVLQEQSTLPLKNRARFHDNVRLFDSVVRASGARTVLYLTWARASAPATQDAITTAVDEIASEVHATIAPVGVAWQHASQVLPHLALHLPDGSHPTVAGACLAAFVFCASVWQVPATTVTCPSALDVDVDTARALAAIADTVAPTRARAIQSISRT